MKWILVAMSIGLTTLASASENGGWWPARDAASQSSGVSNQLFTPSERRILREYLGTLGLIDNAGTHERDQWKNTQQNKKPLPPGLQKKLARGGELPPGWQKKVARGEVLDRSLFAASSALPPGVARQLRHYDGTSVRRIDDRVVRILDATGVILDVLTGR
jgi:hypothetical protein